MYKFISRFSLCKQEAQREKLTKEKRRREISPSSEGEEAYAASTAPPFEKGGRKLFDKR